MEASARVPSQPAGRTYVRRQPEKTALYQVLQRHLLTFERQWTDEANGRTLPKFVLEELHGFMSGDCLTIEAGFRCPKPGATCVPICGDGLLVGWESLLDAEPSCDAGDQPGSGCDDGLVTRYEDCDCGKDAVSLPIACIGPNDRSYGNCTFGCTWGPFCGDGIVNIPDEECDLGGKNGTPGRNGCTAVCTTPHYCGDGILDTDFNEERDLGALNGVRLDQEGKPSNRPDAMVVCGADCTIALPTR